MTVTTWHEEPISKKHDRDAFDCGEEALNEFLRRYARKSHELGGAKTFYGAVPLLDAPLSLLLPLATIEAALKHAGK